MPSHGNGMYNSALQAYELAEKRMIYLDKQRGIRTPWMRGVFGMFAVVVSESRVTTLCRWQWVESQNVTVRIVHASESQEHRGHNGVAVEDVDQATCALGLGQL